MASASRATARAGVLLALVAALLAVLVLAGGPAAAAGLEVPQRTPEEVRDTVDDVLGRAEFREEQPSALARARRWVLDRLARLITVLAEGGGGSVLGWILVFLFVAAAVFFARRFVKSMTRDPEVAAALPTAVARTGADWRAEAGAAEQRGEWRDALRFRYRALVADLAARGLVDEVPGRTAGEYRIQMGRAAPAVAPDFGGATELFELAWYGNRPTGRDESSRFQELAGRVLAGASS